MFVYNVTVKILPEIKDEWLHWMRAEHMPEVLATKQFASCSLFQLLEPQDEEGLTFIAQYKTDDVSKYEKYIEEYAPVLREKGFARFGDRFIAFRSFMELIA